MRILTRAAAAMFLLSLGAAGGPEDDARHAADAPRAQDPAPRWWKGNTHTHTLWSDGNGAPELVASWYVDHDYNFLVLSDHNILSEGEKWFAIEEGGRLTDARVQELREAFGDEWVTVRETEDGRAMRLKTLDELRARFEETGRFIFIQGEEISDGFRRLPVHVNGMNLRDLIPPQGGETLREVLQRNIDAVIEQGRRLGRPVLAHVNHPNFGWALSPEDVASIRGERFFEVYNGHPAVRNEGSAERPSVEQMWDIALSMRLTELDLGVLYGLATDDAHDYFTWRIESSNPGRGWVMVRAAELTPESIVEAMRAGDFYGSSGVTIRSFGRDEDSCFVSIEPDGDATFTTRFIGTRLSPDGMGPVGEVLHETDANPALYRFRGDELYVRAKVISSRPHPNPYAQGDRECAWLQPVVLGAD